MQNNPKSPKYTQDVGAYEVQSVAETVQFYTAAGAADAGEAAGTVVYAQLRYFPVKNFLGGRVGDVRLGNALKSSFSFTNGVMVLAQEKSFSSIHEEGNQPLENNGDWALDYSTGRLMVKKATTAVNIQVTYKIASRESSSSSSLSGPNYSGYFPYENANFVVGQSPLVLDVNTDLGQNANGGYINIDGAAGIQVEISEDGTNYGPIFNLNAGDIFSLKGKNANKIRLTHVADTSYKIFTEPK